MANLGLKSVGRLAAATLLLLLAATTQAQIALEANTEQASYVELREQIDYLRQQGPEAGQDSLWQSALRQGSNAYQRLLSLDRSCRALTQGMQSGVFGYEQRWLLVVEQLQANLGSDGYIAVESETLLRELATQAYAWNQNLSVPQRMSGVWNRKKIDLQSSDLPSLIDSYFRTGITDVCRVARPDQQVKRFQRIQEVLVQSNPALAAQVLIDLGPYLLEAQQER